jgi:hypothetical protein
MGASVSHSAASRAAAAVTGVDGNGPKRFSVQRKMAIVARLLRGEPLELVARESPSEGLIPYVPFMAMNHDPIWTRRRRFVQVA